MDALSRLPLEEPAMVEEQAQEESVLMMEVLERGPVPVTSDTIRKQTSRDPVLARVKNMVAHGNWSAAERSEDTRPYASRKWELSVQGDCILWGEPSRGTTSVSGSGTGDVTRSTPRHCTNEGTSQEHSLVARD